MNNNQPEGLPLALKGNPDAFAEIVETYQRPVFNLCYRMLGTAEDAEDASQETFLRAYNGLRSYDTQRSFSTWLLSIAAHYCIDQIRRRRMVMLSMDQNPTINPPDPAKGPEAITSQNEQQRQIQALLSTLSPQDRAAVVMLYWYDFSYQEIADALGLTVSAVKSRLHRARRDLATQWQTHAPIIPSEISEPLDEAELLAAQQADQSQVVERRNHGELQTPAF